MANRPTGKPGHAACVLAWAALALAPVDSARADTARPDVSDPGQFRCQGRNPFSGAPDGPVEKQDESGYWPYAAFFVDPVLGTPTIVYGPRFRTLDPLMQAFIRRHECQHANGVRDEITANCMALVHMRAQGLTTRQEAHLQHWHQAEGRLDPQYGGSGAMFWERTLRCAAGLR
ncbi:hypothetical protein O4H66_09315 [Comamonadaceae bacterium G21597-S1]|nr:hypothetical protein [Comamonadaceae bacterium G21597-S1]